MSVPFIILSVLHVIVSIGLVAVILMQSKRSAGLTSVVGGMGGQAGTYWDKNKGRSVEGMLEKYTKIMAVAFFILTVILNFVK